MQRKQYDLWAAATPGEMQWSLPLAEQAGTVLWLSQLEAVLGIRSLHFQKDLQLVPILNTQFAVTQ